MVVEWINVQEKMPQNNIEVIAWCGSHWIKTRLIGGYFADNHESITHWSHVTGPSS